MGNHNYCKLNSLTEQLIKSPKSCNFSTEVLHIYFLPYQNPTCKVYSTVKLYVLGSKCDGLPDVVICFPFQVQYEDNLPNLVMSYSRDPLNLKLKSLHLNGQVLDKVHIHHVKEIRNQYLNSSKQE